MSPSAPRRRAARPLVLALVVAVFACGDEHRSYSPAQDDEAMVAIAGAWAEPSGLSLSLCEDVATAEANPRDGCVDDHVVRGGGLGEAHTETHPGGGCTMGGCPFGATAYVKGAASGAGLGTDVPVSGVVRLGGDRDPYSFPYRIDLVCDTGQVCAIIAELNSDGRVIATLVLGPSGPGQAETPHALTRTGAATCP
jgi:hypothetical protein